MPKGVRPVERWKAEEQMIVDPARLRRALTLEVGASDADTYRVSGGREPHMVTTDNVPWQCDCSDSVYRPNIRCKHTVAVYLARQLAAPVRRALQRAMGGVVTGLEGRTPCRIE